MHKKENYSTYITKFLEINSKINLISKNDEKYIWEKHIFDSLAIEKFFNKYITPKNLLDIGTGGGFPALPIAITYPQIEVYPLDSIGKKINAIKEISKELNLKNIHPIWDRAENITEKYEVITSRAVASLKKISEYAIPLLTPNGYFIAYKSLKTEEEIKEAKDTIEKLNAKIIDIIQYDLPLEENHLRNLIIIKKV